MYGEHKGGERHVQGMTWVYREGQRICSGHDSGRHGVQWICTENDMGCTEKTKTKHSNVLKLKKLFIDSLNHGYFRDHQRRQVGHREIV